MRTVVGIHSCYETLKVRPQAIREIWFRKDWNESSKLAEIFELSQSHAIDFKEVSQHKLDQLCVGNQGVSLQVEEDPLMPWQFNENQSYNLLALDGLEDPQNLGSILRTAWLLDVKGVFIPSARAAQLSPAVHKVASGGCEHVAVEEFNQLIQPLEQLKKEGFWVYGLSEKAEKTIWDVDYGQKVVLVAGSEMKGMKSQTQKACDDLVKIPQVDAHASLNAAISIAITLGEVLRQQKATAVV